MYCQLTLSHFPSFPWEDTNQCRMFRCFNVSTVLFQCSKEMGWNWMGHNSDGKSTYYLNPRGTLRDKNGVYAVTIDPLTSITSSDLRPGWRCIKHRPIYTSWYYILLIGSTGSRDEFQNNICFTSHCTDTDAPNARYSDHRCREVKWVESRHCCKHALHCFKRGFYPLSLVRAFQLLSFIAVRYVYESFCMRLCMSLNFS